MEDLTLLSRWFVVLVFAVPALLLAGVNWVILWWSFRPRKEDRHVSFVPLIGGVLGCIALFLTPYPALKQFWWLPFFVDFGCVPYIAFALLWLLWDEVRAKRS